MRIRVSAPYRLAAEGELDREGSARPSELATQHRELVAEHDDLELLELIRAEAQRRELQQALEHEQSDQNEERLLRMDGAGGRLYGREPPHQSRTELMHPTADVGSACDQRRGTGGPQLLEPLHETIERIEGTQSRLSDRHAGLGESASVAAYNSGRGRHGRDSSSNTACRLAARGLRLVEAARGGFVGMGAPN